MKLIALDMDGTLLTSQKTISDRTKEALIQAQEAGIKVVLASGRPTGGMFEVAKELQLHKYGSYLISYNGAELRQLATQKMLYQSALEIDLAKRILNHVKQFNVFPMVYDDTDMYVTDAFAAMIPSGNYKLQVPLDLAGNFNVYQYEAGSNHFSIKEVADLAEIVTKPQSKILVAGEPIYLKQMAEAITEPFVDEITASFSAPFFLELTAKGIDKAQTLQRLLDRYDIPVEEVIAFGDGGNDLSMIQFAGIGVAMGNATDHVKEQADEVTASNDEDGIALVLERILANDKEDTVLNEARTDTL